MYEIAGLDKLIYDKKCRLVWNFVAANEIFILYDYYLFFLWNTFSQIQIYESCQNSKYPITGIIPSMLSLYYLFYLFLSIIFLKFKLNPIKI